MSVVAILFDILLIYFLFGQSLLRRFYPRTLRNRAMLKEQERAFRHVLRMNRDVLSDRQIAALREAAEEARAARRGGQEQDAAERALEDLDARAATLVPRPKGGLVKEYFEVFVVVLAVVFGFRSLFLQPFKIPTGSMQPTLYGIHFVPVENLDVPNPLSRLYEFVNHSRRYVDVTVQQSGGIELIKPASPAIPFFPRTDVYIGGVRYRLPGAMDNVAAYVPKLLEFYRSGGKLRPQFREGEVLARGYLESGDHLFVNRVHLNFAEPKRGDITVFITDDIRDMNGGGLGGRYYIKRLVGLPGDELRIVDHRLYVRAPGQTDFELVDETVHPAFRRIYSFQGGYRGYCHYPGSRYLDGPEATFTVPEDQYFMLGDNSENSRDSRFWGTVPRRNLVGQAAVVWWPFSRRWGTVDRVEPLKTVSLPTMP